MMDFKNFSSDSTYCSFYENKKQSEKRRQRTPPNMTDSKFLDKVHNEVILHFEGKELISRAEVVHYMKRISKMKLKNAKNKYFAEKIQSSLLKIYNVTKQFEKSLSIGNKSGSLDIDENYSFTKDFPLINTNNEDPKQILLKTTSVNDEKSSFPLELLTNDNFISSTQQNAYDSIKEPSVVIITKEPLIGARCNEESNSMNTFLTENSEVYLKNSSSLSIMEDIVHAKHVAADSVQNCMNTDSKEESQLVNHTSSNINEYLQSQDDTTKHISATEILKNATQLEDSDAILQISKLCIKLSLNQNPLTTIPESLNDNLPASVVDLNLKSVMDLGNLFHESYNAKIYKLYYGTGKESTKSNIWQKMENDFTNMQCLAKDTHHTLGELLKKLQTGESDVKVLQYLQLEEKNIHHFNEEDKRKLDIEDLIDANKLMLKQISEEFKIYLNLKQELSEEGEVDEFEMLNWKSLLN